MNQLEQLERKTRLWHIVKAATIIVENTTGKTSSEYLDDEVLPLAVERLMITIGEALRRALDVDERLIHQITSANQIIAFRNQLVHNYPLIDPARVWKIIQVDVPVLLTEVRALLATSDEPA
jgi:uncharacterized protein with HEPN domain